MNPANAGFFVSQITRFTRITQIRLRIGSDWLLTAELTVSPITKRQLPTANFKTDMQSAEKTHLVFCKRR